jgi:hypothetical protein
MTYAAAARPSMEEVSAHQVSLYRSSHHHRSSQIITDHHRSSQIVSAVEMPLFFCLVRLERLSGWHCRQVWASVAFSLADSTAPSPLHSCPLAPGLVTGVSVALLCWYHQCSCAAMGAPVLCRCAPACKRWSRASSCTHLQSERRQAAWCMSKVGFCSTLAARCGFWC